MKTFFKQKAFTLTELMVTTAIMGTLTAMSLPAVKEANERAIQVKCASNLHQLGLAYRMFLDDNNGNFPIQEVQQGGSFLYGWVEALKPYIHQNGAFSENGKKTIYFCPGNLEPVREASTLKNLQTSYMCNYKTEDSPPSVPGGAGGYNESYAQNPSDLVVLMDVCKTSKIRWFGDLKGSPNFKDCFVHNARANSLFLDGRVEAKQTGSFSYKNTCFKGEYPDYWYHYDPNNLN